MNIKCGIFLFAVPHVVPAGLPLNTKFSVYVTTLPAERFHGKSALLRGQKKLRHFFSASSQLANGMPRSPGGETHFQSDLAHALSGQADAPRNFGMCDAVAFQHSADQFAFSVKDGTRVPLESAFLKLELTGLAVTQGVRHKFMWPDCNITILAVLQMCQARGVP